MTFHTFVPTMEETAACSVSRCVSAVNIDRPFRVFMIYICCNRSSNSLLQNVTLLATVIHSLCFIVPTEEQLTKDSVTNHRAKQDTIHHYITVE